MRFIAIILDPGRVWSDYAVVDTERFVRMATCSCQRDAETIAKVLNLRYVERREPIAELPEVTS